MTLIHLFGAQTPAGESLKQQLLLRKSSFPLIAYSRSNPSLLPADFSDPASFSPGGQPGHSGIWISFGPIWLLAPFLEQLALDHPESLQKQCCLIACSPPPRSPSVLLSTP